MFKVGDQVKEKKGYYGELYTIKDITDNGKSVCLNEVSGSWDSEQFQLVHRIESKNAEKNSLGSVLFNDETVFYTDPETGGSKGMKQARPELLPTRVLAEMSTIMAKGAIKYNDHNWRKGYKWSLSVGAAMRHIWRWILGESRDPESGCHHLVHAIINLVFLVTFEEDGIGIDDREFMK